MRILSYKTWPIKHFFQTLDENKGFLNGSIMFWWDNLSSKDYYNQRDSNNWGCSWTVHVKPAEYTIAQVFGGICSTSQTNSLATHSVFFSISSKYLQDCTNCVAINE